MYLVILLFIFLLIGYLLAESPVGEKIDDTALDISRSSKKFGHNTFKRARGLLRIKSLYDRFDAWVHTMGMQILPQEYLIWYTGIDDEEAEKFTYSLSKHMKSLGFRLRELVDGSLEKDPLMRQVFVETIVVYSQEFRKAKQAREDDDQKKTNKHSNREKGDEKKMAKKRPSRRKDDEPLEVDLVDSASSV
jgi:hypothetical protein